MSSEKMSIFQLICSVFIFVGKKKKHLNRGVNPSFLIAWLLYNWNTQVTIYLVSDMVSYTGSTAIDG